MNTIFLLTTLLSFLYIFVAIFKFIRSRKDINKKGKAKKVLLTTVAVFLISFVGAGATAKPIDTQKQASKVENKVKKEDSQKKNTSDKKSETKKTENKNTNTFVEAKVSKVVDGDTIQVLISGKTYKLRMIGVDTPETVHPSKPIQFYGKEASEFTKSNLSDKTVYLQKDVSETDKYGRLLRYVWLSRPASNNPSEQEIIDKMYNAKLVKDGYAHASTYQPDSKYSSLFAKLQNQAQGSSLGLWNTNEEEKFNSQETANSNINDISTTSESNNSSTTSQNSSNAEAFGHDYTADTTEGKIKGNSNSMIYHVPSGKSYNKISVNNVVYFDSEEDAIAAGYRRAKN